MIFAPGRVVNRLLFKYIPNMLSEGSQVFGIPPWLYALETPSTQPISESISRKPSVRSSYLALRTGASPVQPVFGNWKLSDSDSYLTLHIGAFPTQPLSLKSISRKPSVQDTSLTLHVGDSRNATYLILTRKVKHGSFNRSPCPTQNSPSGGLVLIWELSN